MLHTSPLPSDSKRLQELQLPRREMLARFEREAAEFRRRPRAAQSQAVRFLQMHVMDNVRQRIEAGHHDFVDEIRVCTLLFLGFPSLQVRWRSPESSHC